MKKILEFSEFLEKKERELRERQQEALESFYKAAADDAQCHTMESGIAMLAAGGQYIETLMEDEDLMKKMEDLRTSWDKKFMEKYGQRIEAAPDMPVPRIQYFCLMIQELMPQLEDTSVQENWGHAVSEFGEFYVEYIDDAVCTWCDADREVRNFLDDLAGILRMEHSIPENSILDTKNAVSYILSIRPDSKDVKARILLGTTMLFHAYMGMMDLKLYILKTQDME